ncbi:MAG: hypothetical protein GYA60_00355 [Candidatus Methanofastidiosa archaeon]|nr:hypothetical protein [Candidatus Methanofastidiosa archaeon]
MKTSVVTTKGQILIPARVRKKFNIKNRMKIAFIEDGGKLIP